MSNKKLVEMFKTQKSLTEWLEDIKHKDTEVLRAEDNEKHPRLEILNKIIGLPYDKPMHFEATDLRDRTPAFTKYLQSRGNEHCALRLIPKEEKFPKIRMRGKTVKEAYKWFLEQDIDAAKYRADFLAHELYQVWASIFVVNKHGIHGETINGGHHELTQGFHQSGTPITFSYDFKKWTLYPRNTKALAHLKILAELIHITDKKNQAELKKALGASFANNYLEGYFESIDSKDFGTWYKDYSRTLGKLYSNASFKIPAKKAGAKIFGMVGSPGKAKGPVQIVQPDGVDDDFPKGAVLVCAVTTPNYVPLMQKAAAIVTDQGGILSHAAIVARELKKPCIVGTGNATKKLKNGQLVSVNADLGTVTIS
jgi:phosphohistidine swiveling domain-containing protein